MTQNIETKNNDVNMQRKNMIMCCALCGLWRAVCSVRGCGMWRAACGCAGAWACAGVWVGVGGRVCGRVGVRASGVGLGVGCFFFLCFFFFFFCFEFFGFF